MTLAAIQIHILVCQTSNSLNVVKINVKQITYLVMIDSDLVEGHQNPFKDVWKNGAQPFKKSWMIKMYIFFTECVQVSVTQRHTVEVNGQHKC